MNATGHIITGAIVGASITRDPIEFIAIIFGSILPDIDIKNSTLGRYNPFVRFMVHRGHVHSLIGSLIISVPFILIGNNVYIYAVIGCLVHITGDKLYSWLPRHSKFKLKIW